jgi:acyl-CoA synthetase (NDP forming)
VAVITNAGGPAILCADQCEAGGLLIPELSTSLQSHLAAALPRAASVSNPVDLIASAAAPDYRAAVERVMASDEIDALIVIYLPVGLAETAAVIGALGDGVRAARAAGASGKPVLACLMTEEGVRAPLDLGAEKVPTYMFPEAAARVLSRAAAYAAWRAQPLGVIPDFEDLDHTSAQTICRAALTKRGPGWLSAEEVRSVLEAARLPLGPGGVATTPEEAVALARRVGFPVAVKLASHRLVHKTEVGGVRLDLEDADAVRRAFAEIRDRLVHDHQAEAMEGVIVQPMVTGVEVMVGVTQDPLFGPLIAFGMGGIHVEILADVCFRVTPLTDRDAADMVRSIKGYRLLQGYRGHPPADLEALEEVLLRISQLVEEVPEIGELDLNPVFALPPGEGCRVVDARIQVRHPD